MISFQQYQEMQRRLAFKTHELPPPEDAVDREVEQLHNPFSAWLTGKKLPFIHARTDMRSGIAEGAHDYTVFCPKRVVVIEFKSRNGKRSEKQRDWAHIMEMQGYAVPLVFSLEEAKRMVEEAL